MERNEMSIEKDRSRHYAAAHGMQSGVAMIQNYEPAETAPKHLRVGVNSAMSDHSGLVRLLMSKGVITEEEYMTAIADAMERERDSYERRIESITGAKPGTINLC
jgi:hypothetical protein